jgi:hypothetical protein
VVLIVVVVVLVVLVVVVVVVVVFLVVVVMVVLLVVVVVVVVVFVVVVVVVVVLLFVVVVLVVVVESIANPMSFLPTTCYKQTNKRTITHYAALINSQTYCCPFHTCRPIKVASITTTCCKTLHAQASCSS